MLNLINITKDYIAGDNVVTALRGVNLAFREKEFVAILGPSGCGKTTLLNIIGGLDKYTTGDLIINGVSTKDYTDHDWDRYRNHTIGFVFQSYNLIPHQSVLGNVELSLTVSGISASERKQRAIEALEKVGLHDQIYKKPNQLSGGQMQRVAIARAIVNNPDIILADEPTGALDTETSIQVMDILKEISKEHLIIMVTHNPELAETYANRIVRFLDGKVISDSHSLDDQELDRVDDTTPIKKPKKVGISLRTAFTLSFRNLLTKKGRTFLTAFAGSIGIIGIALILSLSHGFQSYINRVEEETLSSYPVSITKVSTDFSSIMSIRYNKSSGEGREEGKIYSNNVLANMVDNIADSIGENDLKSFKTYLDEHREEIKDSVIDIQYTYDVTYNIYKSDYEDNLTKLNPYRLSDGLSPVSAAALSSLNSLMRNLDIWQEMVDNQDFLNAHYDLAAGTWPVEDNDVVLIVDENNGMPDYLMYGIGLRSVEELDAIIMSKIYGTPKPDFVESVYTYEDILNLSYRVITDVDYYAKNTDGLYSKSTEETFVKEVLATKGFDLNIVGIVKPKEGDTTNMLTGAIGYTHNLATRVINYINTSDIITDQLASPTVSVLDGSSLDSFTLETLLENIGYVDLDDPSSILIYPTSFEGKDAVTNLIKQYNANEDENSQIKYTDYVGLLMSSVSTIISAISYILIAFVSISLIVSSIMIGIITYISVLERTKEIGILRSIGASKRDISRVFNSETFMIGLTSGVIGILVTLILNIPINYIIDALSGIGHIVFLPLQGAIILPVISFLLTLIAGLIPSRLAAKKDPVTALRTE